jgi:hypothetical protein
LHLSMHHLQMILFHSCSMIIDTSDQMFLKAFFCDD